jgi:hypothetical protein
MLFTEISELKAHVRITESFNMDDIRHHIRTVEEDYLIPAISQNQYDDLLAAYEASIAETPTPLSADNKKLLEKCRDVIAPIAMYYFTPDAPFISGQTGMMVPEQDDKRTAEKWMIDRAMFASYKRGLKAIDRLLEYLEKNIDTFILWAESDSYTIYKQGFINSVKQFEKFVRIGNSRRTFLALQPIMDRIEENRIQSAISPDLYDAIKEQILDDDLTPENKKLLYKIQSAVANLTIAEGIMQLPLIVDEEGIILSEDPRAMTPEQKLMLTKNRQQLGENDMADLQDFLYKNADNYPLFKESTSYNPTGENLFMNDQDSRTAAFL